MIYASGVEYIWASATTRLRLVKGVTQPMCSHSMDMYILLSTYVEARTGAEIRDILAWRRTFQGEASFVSDLSLCEMADVESV